MTLYPCGEYFKTDKGGKDSGFLVGGGTEIQRIGVYGKRFLRIECVDSSRVGKGIQKRP